MSWKSSVSQKFKSTRSSTDATKGLFTGDKRDGEAPPITRQNFHSVILRYGARALRARLSQLSHAELLANEAAAAHVAALKAYKKKVCSVLRAVTARARFEISQKASRPRPPA